MKPQTDLQKAHERQKNRESLLETLESIIIAFVLAFLFRAFIVEAFVIPTGSMAATLNGGHLEFTCSDCGYPFAVGHEGRSARVSDPVCPNCGLLQRLPDRVPLYSGDRILVLKYLYHFEEPQRWDVVVFRNPNDPAENYIKRLVALPGETIELVHGDVTIDDRVVHKTDKAQEALWMIVHDTRYRPTRRGWLPRWVPDAAWKVRDAGFVFEGPTPTDATAWLTYIHRDPAGRPANLLDFYAYNAASNGRQPPSHICTDLGLHAEVVARMPTSRVLIDLRAYRDRFRFELTARRSGRPTRILVNGRVVAQSADGVLPVGRPVEVLAANVDHKLVLLVGGKRVTGVLSGAATPEGDPTYDPTPLSDLERRQFENPPVPSASLPSTALGAGPSAASGADRAGADPDQMAAAVRIGADGGPVALGYLRLDRDVYYVNEPRHLSSGEGWVSGYGTEGNPFRLEANEFFVCGDNSPRSNDSRLWDLPRPVVPRNNLAGKAFFVYWPGAGWRYGIPVAPDPTSWRFVH